MAELIYAMLTAIFGPGILEKIASFLEVVIKALTETMNSAAFATAIGIFMPIGILLTIVFFYMDLASQASRDMLSLDKLVVAFIKLLIALFFIINCEALIKDSFTFTSGIYTAAKDNIYSQKKNLSKEEEGHGISYWGLDYWPDYETEVPAEINEGIDEDKNTAGQTTSTDSSLSGYNAAVAALGGKNSKTIVTGGTKDTPKTLKDTKTVYTKNSDGSITVSVYKAITDSYNNKKIVWQTVTNDNTTYTDKGAVTSGGTSTSTESKPQGKTLKDHFEDKRVIGTGLKGVFNGLPIMVGLLFPYLICLVAVFASYFISISNAIMLIIYGVYAPIAVAQCFDDVQRSTGVRYIKKFIATGLSFAIIVGCLWAGSTFQGQAVGAIIESELGKNPEINDITMKQLAGSFKAIAAVIAIQFATVGAMFKGTQIANDVMGV